ncbi:MAG: hypothetical protein ACI4XL_04820 [Bacillus sp. (in: firmicutes)]
MKKFENIHLLPYALLLLSLISIYVDSVFAPFLTLAFMIVSINVIDQRHAEAADEERKGLKKRLDIIFRLFLSLIVIMLITNEFFYALRTDLVLYALLFIPLTVLLISYNR